jgi:hypothetical protein
MDQGHQARAPQGGVSELEFNILLIVDLPARFNDEQENANAGHRGQAEHNKKCFHDLGSKKYLKAGDDCADRRQQLPVIERRVR